MIREAQVELAGIAVARPGSSVGIGIGSSSVPVSPRKVQHESSVHPAQCLDLRHRGGPRAGGQRDDSKSNDERGSKSSSAKLIVPLTGTVVGGGTFTGSFSIVRFENRSGTIHAIGMVSGVVGGALARSGISGPLALP